MNNKRLRMLNNELGLNDYAEVPNSQTIIEKVNNCINDDPIERRLFMKRKILNSVLVAVLILTLASLTVIAATLGWHHKLIDYFNNPTKQEMEQLAMSTSYPLVSANNEKITVNVIQTLADNHGIYVLYEIEGIGKLEDNEVLSWEKEKLKIQYSSNDKKVGQGGYAYSKMIGNENDKCTMLYIRTGIGTIKNQKLIFELQNLHKKVISNGSVVKDYEVATCNFDLSWDFEFVNSTTTWEINQKINNGLHEVKEIDISPISMWIRIAGEEINDLGEIKVELKNGNTLIITDSDYNVQYTPLYNGINTISTEFSTIVMVDEIKQIRIKNEILILDN